jgi:hypothetical protein
MAPLAVPAWTGLPVRPVQALTGLGVVLLAGAATWPELVLSHLGVWSAMAAFAGAAAVAMDEAALEVVRSTPAARHRWVARFGLAALALVTALVMLVPVAVQSPTVAWWVPALELTGLVLVAVGVTTSLAGRLSTPGELVAESLAVAVLAVTVANPVGRWVEVLPLDASGRWGPTGALWGVLVVGSSALLVRGLRDPLP